MKPVVVGIIKAQTTNWTLHPKTALNMLEAALERLDKDVKKLGTNIKDGSFGGILLAPEFFFMNPYEARLKTTTLKHKDTKKNESILEENIKKRWKTTWKHNEDKTFKTTWNIQEVKTWKNAMKKKWAEAIKKGLTDEEKRQLDEEMQFLWRTKLERPVDIKSKCLTEFDKNYIVSRCLALSKKYKHIFFIPGTIIWRMKLSHIHGLNEKNEKVQRRKWLKEQLDNGIFKSSLEIQDEVNVGEKWIGGYSGDDLKALKNKLENYNYVMRNSAIGFLNGKEYRYDKKSNFGEEKHDEKLGTKTVFLAGTRPSIYTIDNYMIGVEVCADHTLGVLKHEAEKNKLTKNGVDLHILLAGSNDAYAHNFCIKDKNSYFIHADSMDSACKICQRTDKGKEFRDKAAMLWEKRFAAKKEWREAFNNNEDVTKVQAKNKKYIDIDKQFLLHSNQQIIANKSYDENVNIKVLTNTYLRGEVIIDFYKIDLA